jgi:hypothetical protein
MAANAIRSLTHGCNCQHSWDRRFAELLAVADHGTSDGKPYVEPQPEIGGGYRLATEADKWRRDRELYDSAAVTWFPANPGVYLDSVTYRVPVDRIPTDEDAKQRPTVMVKDLNNDDWLPRTLLHVCNENLNPFLVISGGGFTTWRLCRFQYPGELD